MKEPKRYKDPPETSDDWADIWDAVEKANEGWFIIGPLVAVRKNWKAWLVAVGVFLMFNNPDVIAALRVLAEGLAP